MSTLFVSDTARRAWTSAWWLVPAVALGLLIGSEVDWGRHLFVLPSAPTLAAPKPVDAAVLPEYRIEGGLAARSETVGRTLFNPTRRPAASLATEGDGPRRLQTGRFVLVGTSVSGDQKVAFLKEASGGRARTVRQGEEIDGMQVALVASDRVKFTAGDDAEELMLRVAKGPKTTLVAVPAAVGSAPALPAAQAVPNPVVPPRAANAPVDNAAGRRAARRAAAQAAAQGGAEATPGAGATPPQQGQAAPQGSWDAVYQNMQRQRR
jgi:hypothetical protein